MSRASKLKFMSVVIVCLIAICGIGLIVAIKEWHKYQQNTQAFETANTEPMAEDPVINESPTLNDPEPDQTGADLLKDKRAQAIERLYQPEARQLANDFGMSTNPEIKLSMCRHPDITQNKYLLKQLPRSLSKMLWIWAVLWLPAF